jgi:hypothetical protein
VAVVNDPEGVKPSPTLNVPLGLKIWSNAVVVSESFPDVQGAALVAVQMKPVAVPGVKPVIVLVAPTLPVTTEVPVFETLPPKSPKELEGEGMDKSGLPKAGAIPTAPTTNKNNLNRIPSPSRTLGASG